MEDPVELTPRQREVVILIGRDRLSYKAAAKCLENCHTGEPRVSWRTVREHAEAVRDRMGVDLAPRDAVTRFYWQRADALWGTD